MESRLSIVIGCADAGLDLVRTLESLDRSKHLGTELVLVPPEPTDGRQARFYRGVASRWDARLVPVSAEGPAARRNAGVRAARGPYVLMLEPGDRVEPAYPAAAISALEADPQLALVACWVRLEIAPERSLVLTSRGLELGHLLVDPGAVPPSAIFRRSSWEEVSGFDEGLPCLEAYDFWLSVLERGHRAKPIDAAYVRHEPRARSGFGESSGSPAQALDSIYRRHRNGFEGNPGALLAGQERLIRELVERNGRLLARRTEAEQELEALDRQIAQLEAQLADGDADGIDWGELRRTSPLSRDWGYDRAGDREGTPVDRHYVERFLESAAGDIRGNVLEVQEADYTRRFGGGQVEHSDVVDVNASNPRATILADLRHADPIPSDRYDCFILTQTLHVVDDMEAVLREALRVLKPGGVLLATFPCASRVCVEYGEDGDFWRLTEAGVRRLLARVFPPEAVETCAWGNVLANAAFLYGAAREELSEAELDAFDPYFPLLVSARAVKPGGAVQEAPAARAPGVVWRRRAREGGAVLLYHRVAEPPSDVHGLAVSPADFREQMEALHRDFHPVALATLVESARQGFVPEGAVAVTFDDGYVDALETASPILSELQIPATFFVTTGVMETGSEYWWDALERILLSPRPVPPLLELDLDGQARRLPTARETERREAYDLVHRALVRASREERETVLGRLFEWCGHPRSPRPENRALDEEQVRRLARRPLHTVGAHTVHHLALSAQPSNTVEREIVDGRRRLAEIVGRPVEALAYPYGDVSPEAVAAARAAGFTAAVTCEEALVTPGVDPLLLPRFEVKAEDGVAFRRRLRALLQPD